uniref:Uncharacterized protein n=1 Tax=Arundo donax TaxID=35708 RepID=A0A0A9B7H8_ARUDO
MFCDELIRPVLPLLLLHILFVVGADLFL